MKRILFLSKGEDSPSTRYRALQFFPRLSEAGFEPVHVTMAGSPGSYLGALAEARRADVVVVLRKTLPGMLLWSLRKCARRLVFDFDDAIFANSDGSASATRAARFAAMARASDHLFAGNAFLAERAAACNPAVTVVPTCIDAARYDVTAEKPADHVDLVWIGSRSTRKYLEQALPALRLAAERVPGLRLKIIADFDLPDAGIETVPVRWSAEREARELASSHVGIAPMADNDWTRGKCALKVLQYMAAGLPVVSSRAGVNAEVVRPGDNGFLADSPEDWARAIEDLAGAPALRENLGRAGRELVLSRYATGPVFETLKGALERLA